jgi:hypothetical protein
MITISEIYESSMGIYFVSEDQTIQKLTVTILSTCDIIKSIDLSSTLEAASRWSSQKFTNVIWNPNVHYSVHKSKEYK